jgi:hypothetical protein
MDWITGRVWAALLALGAVTYVPGDFPVAALPASEPAPLRLAKCLFGQSATAVSGTFPPPLAYRISLTPKTARWPAHNPRSTCSAFNQAIFTPLNGLF